MKSQDGIIKWLLEGDPAVRWQTKRDLAGSPEAVYKKDRKKIAGEGWGAELLSFQDEAGTWAGGLYSPKWTSTVYTLKQLRLFGLMPGMKETDKACRLMIDKGFYTDGGINFFNSWNRSETCVTAMVLMLLSYFRYKDKRKETIVDFLLNEQLNDGGWNCISFRGDKHSSFHTTLMVLECLLEYRKESSYRKGEIISAAEKAHEFLLVHRLYKSHRTGKTVDDKMTRFPFPPRWRYDILCVLDYLREAGVQYDKRMQDAIELILKKRNKDGTWNQFSQYPGRRFIDIERAGKPGRWNTLRAMRVLMYFEAL